jgi:exopolysaccharide biosynthesis glucuronosyltransferase PssE
VTFVTVGNATQPFARLLEAVETLAACGGLPAPVIVQSGNNPRFASRVCLVRPFLRMEEFEQHIASADLIIGHAGAGTVVHALAAGRTPVVMPRRARHGEHVDDHQVEFVRRLAAEGRVFPAWEPGELVGAVALALVRRLEPVAVTRSLVAVVSRQIDELVAARAAGRGRAGA